VIFGLYEQRIRQLVEPKPEGSVKVLRVVNPNPGAEDDEDDDKDHAEDVEVTNKWKFHYTTDLENTVLNKIDAISEW